MKRATHKSKRQIEEIIAELRPRPDAPAVMRKLPARRTQPTPDSGQSPDAVVPATPDRSASPSPEQRPDAVAVSPALALHVVAHGPCPGSLGWYDLHGRFSSPISVDLSPEQEAALLESAKRLNVVPEALAGAAIRDFLVQQEADFQAAADRVLRKNKELYRRLA